jgi:uncharacterized membrane protein
MSYQAPATDITSDDKLMGLLAYLFSPLAPIILLLMEDKKKRPFIKYHAVQSLVIGVLIYVLSFTVCVPLVGFVAAIYCAIKAYQGEYVNLPVITDFIKKQNWV